MRERSRHRFAELELHPHPPALRRSAEWATLQPQPGRASALLLQRAGETLTRAELRHDL